MAAALDALTHALKSEFDPRWNIKVRTYRWYQTPMSSADGDCKVSLIVLGTVRTPMAGRNVVLPPPPAYADPSSPAGRGQIVSLAQDPTAKQGDPRKLAQKIYELTLLEDPPFRLTLGQDSLTVVNGYVENIIGELEQYKAW